MYKIQKLPLNINFLDKKIIKKTILANRALAELNWVAEKIPNQNILINSLSLQEAKDSSEVENIITTHDELYKAQVDKNFSSKEAKEVENYREALLYGFNQVKNNWLLLNRDILKIQEILEKNDAGFRTQSGTKLENSETKETIYLPPQNPEEIKNLMENLEKYINDENLEDLDELIKMAIIHHQFESIHPFYDWNWRTWRIINILYLVKNNLLDIPILYLSNYIIKNKNEYYRLLQAVRDENVWEEWIFYMLDAVEKTAINTTKMINEIYILMGKMKKSLKENKNINFYSKDLLEILFSHPYTKIEFVEKWLWVTRKTASRYLNELTNLWFFEVIQIKNSKYFVNIELFELLRKWLD